MNVSVNPRSRFTPSLMSHELLERLFVAREQTLDRIILRVTTATTSSERNHTLLVGPRGSGKTHLVSLAYYRARDLQKSGAALQLAWLPEDPWTIVSYLHLMRAIAERLEPALEGSLPTSAPELEALLVRRAESGGPIVVIVENLDQILDALGNQGQQQLRHVLQTHRPFLLITTSTRLDRALSDQAAPFYGFFTTSRLEQFDVGQAAAMLSAIAAENSDDRLVKYLHSNEGQKRLQTIAHLAGGQPRIWALLASALTVEGLGELIELLLTRFDDLTPYYQEQIGHLSGQQRLIIAQLADIDRPINVTELAQRLTIDQRSLSKTLSELVDRGWINPTRSTLTAGLDRRRTYYELAEPLARLAFQIKDSRGEPLRLIVEFLKHWFDPPDLRAPTAPSATEYVALAVAGQEHDPVVAVTRRLNRLPVTRARVVDLLGEIDDALAALGNNDPESLLRLPTPIRAALERELEARTLASIRAQLHRAAWDEFGEVPHPAMTAWITRAEKWITSPQPDDGFVAQAVITGWLTRAWRFAEAEEALITMTQMLDAEHLDTLGSRYSLGLAYESAGRLDQASPLFEETLAARERLLSPDDRDTLATRGSIASLTGQTGDARGALELFKTLLLDRERVLGHDDPDTLDTRNNIAFWTGWGGNARKALQLFRELLDDQQRVLGADHPDTLRTRNHVAFWTGESGEGREALALQLFCELLRDQRRVLAADHRDTLTIRSNIALFTGRTGDARKALQLFRELLSDRERVLGADHPDTLRTRSNIASWVGESGKDREALRLFREVLPDQQRAAGADHLDTLRTRSNIALFTGRTGDAREALRLFRELLSDQERVLGAGHPDTLATRSHIDSLMDIEP